MLKYIITLTFALYFTVILYSKDILSLKKAAKVGDEIILKNEVEDLAKRNGIDEKAALEILINRTLLYLAAKMYVSEPTEEQIEETIKRQKIHYASQKGKDYKNVTDEEFFAFLHYNNMSMSKYKVILKKTLWIKSLIEKLAEEEKNKPFNPTDKEIEDFINKNPEYFEEKEGVLISMIYFSYYDKNQNEVSKEEKEKIKKRAEICFNELISGAKFEDLVIKYSDDLISKNAETKGRVGYLYFDDPKVYNSFNEEIIGTLKVANPGVINRIFETKNGLYIFRIDEKLKPQKLLKEQAIIKAREILRKRYFENLYTNVENKIIDEMKKKVIVVIY